MRNLVRAAAIFAGVVGVSGAAALLAVGCGGDDTVVGLAGPDSGPDVFGDSNADTSIVDSGADSRVLFDAGPPNIGAFASQINQTGCAWVQACCGGPTIFNATTCLRDFNDPATDGFLFTRPLLDTIDGGGNVTFDQSKASQCLLLIQDLPCGTQTSAQLTAIRDACYGAIIGNIPASGTGCQSSIECAPPTHCESFGGGTCVAPYATSGACVLGGDTPAESLGRCGRHEEGLPGYCQVGGFVTASEAGTCAPPEGPDASCYGPYECASWICDTTDTPGHCAGSEVLINSDVCAAYPPDGG